MRQVSRAGLTFRERLLGHVDTSMHSGSEISAAHRWLAERGVTGIVRFPVQRFDSDNAPQRRAMRGTPMPVRAVI